MEVKEIVGPRPDTVEILPLNEYDKIIVAFSGGKDSMACLLHLFELGVPSSQIELWHHDIDGREGSHLMDWRITPAYCRQVAKAFNIPIYFSWKEGGFEQEMTRENTPTGKIFFEEPQPDGSIIVKSIGGNGPLNTRLKFPQVAADLKTRWCSAYLKINVCASAVRNQERFLNKKVLILSGERGEESSARSKYPMAERDRSDSRESKKKKRYIDRWRPIRDWTEEQVWDLIKKYKVRAHPAYFLGFGRCSCQFCIFGNANQFATAAKVSPERFWNLADYETLFGVTIKRKESLADLVAKGTVYEAFTEEMAEVANSDTYSLPVIMEEWILPAGAFAESCGPL